MKGYPNLEIPFELSKNLRPLEPAKMVLSINQLVHIYLRTPQIDGARHLDPQAFCNFWRRTSRRAAKTTHSAPDSSLHKEKPTAILSNDTNTSSFICEVGEVNKKRNRSKEEGCATHHVAESAEMSVAGFFHPHKILPIKRLPNQLFSTALEGKVDTLLDVGFEAAALNDVVFGGWVDTATSSSGSSVNIEKELVASPDNPSLVSEKGNRDSALLAVSAIATGIALTFTIVQIPIRVIIIKNVGWDDVYIVVANVRIGYITLRFTLTDEIMISDICNTLLCHKFSIVPNIHVMKGLKFKYARKVSSITCYRAPRGKK